MTIGNALGVPPFAPAPIRLFFISSTCEIRTITACMLVNRIRKRLNGVYKKFFRSLLF